MKNSLEDLRNHLFETIEKLSDAKEPMDINRARVINHTAQVLINSGKLEVQLMQATGNESGGGFFKKSQPALIAGTNGKDKK
jgi:hypothetical protein